MCIALSSMHFDTYPWPWWSSSKEHYSNSKVRMIRNNFNCILRLSGCNSLHHFCKNNRNELLLHSLFKNAYICLCITLFIMHLDTYPWPWQSSSKEHFSIDNVRMIMIDFNCILWLSGCYSLHHCCFLLNHHHQRISSDFVICAGK